MTESPFYPFGGNGEVPIEFCYKEYPLDGDDLELESNSRPKFGIKTCSNVFSGAHRDLQGFVFDPPLLQLTDEILKAWYHNHNKDEYDMPFSHDLANPSCFPHIRYRRVTNIHDQLIRI